MILIWRTFGPLPVPVRSANFPGTVVAWRSLGKAPAAAVRHPAGVWIEPARGRLWQEPDRSMGS